MFKFHFLPKAHKILFLRPALFFILSAIYIFSTTGISQAVSLDSNIHEGIADYNQNNFEQAESNFSKAQKEQPDNPKLNYNLANSRYKTGKYQEALETYNGLTTEEGPKDIKQKSLYNSGNTFFRMGKLEEAETAYKKALELDSKDMDTKYNLEFVREQIKKKEQEKQQQGSDSNKDQSKNQDSPENESDEGDPQNSTNPEDQNPSSENKPEQELPSTPEESQESQSSNPAQAQSDSISKDQADHWLSALDEDLKKFRKKQADKANPGSPVGNRDW